MSALEEKQTLFFILHQQKASGHSVFELLLQVLIIFLSFLEILVKEKNEEGKFLIFFSKMPTMHIFLLRK